MIPELFTDAELTIAPLVALLMLAAVLLQWLAWAAAQAVLALLDPSEAGWAAHDAEFDPFDHHGDFGGPSL